MRIIPAAIAVKLPNGIPHKIGCNLMTKGLTSNYLITKLTISRLVKPYLFHAAAGGVGQIFTEMG